MILGFLISILSATYTIASSNSVVVEGTPPQGSEVVYSRTGTGQKDRITAGNSITLQLSGWDACVIDSVVLSMHSNTSQGAGSLTLHIGDELVWEIAETDFANVAWNGSFTTSWVDVSSAIDRVVQPAENMRLYIEASKNSLYIQSCTIYYTLPLPSPYEVTFESGLEIAYPALVEESIGAGVLLPQGIDTLEWHFVGWSEKEVLEADTCPRVWRAGERYFPKHNCRLWAVYSDIQGAEQIVEYVSGDYLLANSFWQVGMKGAVLNGVVAAQQVDLLYSDTSYVNYSSTPGDMLYSVVFQDDSTLTIQHVVSGGWVGYSGTKLSNQSSKWRYRILPDGSLCIYYVYSGGERMLTFGYGPNATYDQVVAYSSSVSLDLKQSDGWLLFAAHDGAGFTSWPFGFDDIEDVFVKPLEDGVGDCVLLWGNYRLQIRNGRKYLYICQ